MGGSLRGVPQQARRLWRRTGDTPPTVTVIGVGGGSLPLRYCYICQKRFSVRNKGPSSFRMRCSTCIRRGRD